MAKFLLKDTSVMKLIKKVLGETHEGYLLFEQDSKWKKLFFRNGKVIGASSNNKSDYLGQYLVSYGVIDIDQFDNTCDTELNTGKMMKIAFESVNSEILKQIIFEKIIDTIFLAARWDECVCSVVSEKTFKSQTVNLELSPYDIAAGLKKSIDEFRSILDTIPELGARPKINSTKSDSYKVSNQEETILNYISAEKTITEILSIMPPHNYMLFKALFNLSNEGIIEKGTGFPLSRDDIIELVNNSDKCKKCSQTVSDMSLNIFTSSNEDDYVKNDEDKHLEAISKYQDLHHDDPENSLYSHRYVQAKSCFVVDFYNNKLSPFAVIEITGDLRKIADANEIDTEVYKKIKKEGGRGFLKNIIKSMENRNEIDVLRSIDKFLDNGVIKDVEPKTFIDAIALGRNKYLEKLFEKSEKNKFFKMDISKSISPLMFSVISGTISCESSDEEIEEKQFSKKGRFQPGLHDFEMTFLMFASMIGNYEAAEFLLSQNANINLHNGNGVTALMLALQNGHDDLAWHLLGSGADVNAKNTNGYSALMIATSKGMSHIVDRMIKLGVDVNQANKKGQTALNSALRFDHEDVVVSLIAAGTDLSIPDSEGHTPLYYAESAKMKELIGRGAGNSRIIKKKEDKKKRDSRYYGRNIFKDKKDVVPGSFPVLIFSAIFFATSYMSVSVLFFSGEDYGLTSRSRRVVEELGMEYCEKFKLCRENIPEHILAKCSQIGVETISENFRNAKSCDKETVEECRLCIRSVSCEDFYKMYGSNLFKYCNQCIGACK